MAACAATRKDGRPCTTPVVGDASYCFAHDPALAAKRANARRKAGENRASAKRLTKLLPPRLIGVFDVLEQALTDVLDGSLEPRQATAAAALARALVSVLMAGELEARVKTLEERGIV
jgi:hypothetical protein